MTFHHLIALTGIWMMGHKGLISHQATKQSTTKCIQNEAIQFNAKNRPFFYGMTRYLLDTSICIPLTKT